MNLSVDDARVLLKETHLDVIRARLPETEPEMDAKTAKMPEIVLSSYSTSFKSFQAWCIQQQGKTVKIVTAPKDGKIYTVEADKIVFDPQFKFCTLPTNPVVRLSNPSDRVSRDVLDLFEPLVGRRR